MNPDHASKKDQTRPRIDHCLAVPQKERAVNKLHNMWSSTEKQKVTSEISKKANKKKVKKEQDVGVEGSETSRQWNSSRKALQDT